MNQPAASIKLLRSPGQTLDAEPVLDDCFRHVRRAGVHEPPAKPGTLGGGIG